MVVPRFKYPGNLGALQRTCVVLGATLVTRPMGRREKGRVDHVACQHGSAVTVDEERWPRYLATFDQVLVLETPDFWASRGIPYSSIYTTDVSAHGKVACIVGHEHDGVDLDDVAGVGFEAVCIPQDEHAVCGRKGVVHVSLNMSVAGTIALSSITTRRLLMAPLTKKEATTSDRGGDPARPSATRAD